LSSFREIRQYCRLPWRQRFHNIAVETDTDVSVVQVEKEPAQAAKRSAYDRARWSPQQPD